MYRGYRTPEPASAPAVCVKSVDLSYFKLRRSVESRFLCERMCLCLSGPFWYQLYQYMKYASQATGLPWEQLVRRRKASVQAKFWRVNLSFKKTILSYIFGATLLGRLPCLPVAERQNPRPTFSGNTFREYCSFENYSMFRTNICSQLWLEQVVITSPHEYLQYH